MVDESVKAGVYFYHAFVYFLELKSESLFCQFLVQFRCIFDNFRLVFTRPELNVIERNILKLKLVFSFDRRSFVDLCFLCYYFIDRNLAFGVVG